MLKWAKEEKGVSRIATGHYARIKYANSLKESSFATTSGTRHQLLRGLDRSKDQSYFLYDLPQKVLGNLILPLGELTKKETRIEANKLNLRTAQKAESQDLCLSEHHGSMKAFLDKYIPE